MAALLESAESSHPAGSISPIGASHDDDNDFDDLFPAGRHIKLRKKPHQSLVNINDLVVGHGIHDLYSTLARFSLNRDDGSTLRPSYFNGQEPVPDDFQFIDLWYSFRLLTRSMHYAYPTATATVYARPKDTWIAGDKKRLTEIDEFTPVLVCVDERRTDIHRMSFRELTTCSMITTRDSQVIGPPNCERSSSPDVRPNDGINLPRSTLLYSGSVPYPECRTGRQTFMRYRTSSIQRVSVSVASYH